MVIAANMKQFTTNTMVIAAYMKQFTTKTKQLSANMKQFPTKMKKSPPGPPAKTFFCVFCRDIVSLAVGNLVQFKTHMETGHQIFYEFDILLALNFIDRKEKEKIIDTVKSKVNGKSVPAKEDVVVSAKAEESLLKEDADWGNLDNVQVVILDENTSIKDALKNVSVTPVVKPKAYTEPAKSFKDSLKSVLVTPVVKPKPVKSFVSEVKVEPIQPEILDIKTEIKQETILMSSENKIPKNRSHQCGKCNKMFPSKFNLRNHMKKKFSCLKPILECEKCSKVFKDKKAFQIHMARTKSCVRPKCDKCAKIFKTTSDYRVHMARKKSCIKTNLSCEKCSKTFNKKKNYEVHIARTKSCVKPSTKCEDCLKVFSNGSSFRAHIANKGTVCKKRVSCEKCGKLVRESKYQLHLNKKRGCVQVSLKCDDCLKVFSTRGAARMHQLKKETVCKKRIECERCGERYKEELYKKHILKSCVKVECQKCGEKFTEGKLKLHLQKKRSCVVEEPKCDDCGKTFSCLATAKKHMADQNGQCNMKFGCENCGNSFNGIHSLKMHQRTNKHCLQLQSVVSE